LRLPDRAEQLILDDLGKAMMALSGVRNSWLIFARNSDLLRLAKSPVLLPASGHFGAAALVIS